MEGQSKMWRVGTRGVVDNEGGASNEEDMMAVGCVGVTTKRNQRTAET
jgi:hypothetical protein